MLSMVLFEKQPPLQNETIDNQQALC